MANTTVYPFGTNGTMPSSIGVINDLSTGGATNALSAEMGKELKSEIGEIAISRMSGVADGKYFKKAVGETVNPAYPNNNANYRTYKALCSKGDVIQFGTGTGNNIPAYLVCDSSNVVLAAGELYDSSTPKAVPDLLITDDGASYIIINSIGETTNIINSDTSLNARIRAIENDLSDDIFVSREIEVYPLLMRNCRFADDGSIIRSSFTAVAYELNMQGLSATKMSVPIASGNVVGFVKDDGTWVVAYDNTASGATNRVVFIDVPSGAITLKGTYDVGQSFSGFFLTTGEELDRYSLKGESYVAFKDKRDTLLPIVESNKTGRFAYDTVGVMDYLNAFDELSYTFPDFVKKTKIGDSQTPLASKADQSIYPINRYTYTKSGANPTKKFVFAGGLHGDSEGWTNNGGDAPQNIVTLYFFLLDMLTHCEDDPLYKKLTDNYVIEVLPVMNPWGVQNHSRYNGRDVDLNRQFPNNWDASTSEHKGSAPLSEAESIAISDFLTGLNSNGGFDRYIEIHARGEVLLPSDNRFFGVTPTSDVYKCSAASYYMISKYGGQGGFTGEGANPTVYSWVSFILGVAGCDVECCQSLKNDVSTRNSKLVNFQMTDYVKWSILMQLDIV